MNDQLLTDGVSSCGPRRVRYQGADGSKKSRVIVDKNKF